MVAPDDWTRFTAEFYTADAESYGQSWAQVPRLHGARLIEAPPAAVGCGDG